MPASQLDAPLANGHDSHTHPSPTKKPKGKKAMDNNEATRLLHARISQLEQDAAGEKDQELEIGASCPRRSQTANPMDAEPYMLIRGRYRT
jgi:hypothetical protein